MWCDGVPLDELFPTFRWTLVPSCSRIQRDSVTSQQNCKKREFRTADSLAQFSATLWRLYYSVPWEIRFFKTVVSGMKSCFSRTFCSYHIIFFSCFLFKVLSKRIAASQPAASKAVRRTQQTVLACLLLEVLAVCNQTTTFQFPLKLCWHRTREEKNNITLIWIQYPISGSKKIVSFG